MIQSIRRKHLYIFFFLTLFSPLVFVVGLVARKPIPLAGSLPEILVREIPSGAVILLDQANLWGENNIHTRVYEGANQPDMFLALEPETDLRLPDVLVYWGTRPGIDNARLLGVLSGTEKRVFPLPVEAKTNQGRLVLYSLAHQTLVAEALLPLGVDQRGNQ